jgi:Uncharacterized conserved protein (DUF2190)
MSYNEGRERTFKSSADLRTKQYFAVALDTANQNQVVLANAQTLPTIGIVKNAPNTGDEATVVMSNGQGSISAIAGAEVNIGAYVTPDAAGKLIATTTAGDYVVGRAITYASGDGKTFEIELLGFRY